MAQESSQEVVKVCATSVLQSQNISANPTAVSFHAPTALLTYCQLMEVSRCIESVSVWWSMY